MSFDDVQLGTKRGGVLTPREQQILELIWQGLSNREIAQQLWISRKTVEAHRTNLMKKLRTRNVAQTIHAASTLGLLPSTGRKSWRTE